MRNCENIGKKKKIRYGLKKTRIVKTGLKEERRDSRRKCKIMNSTEKVEPPKPFNLRKRMNTR